MGFTDSDKETGFLAEFVACDRVLSKKPGFWAARSHFWWMGDRVLCGWAIGFCVDGRSGFVWMGESVIVEIPAVGNRVYTNDVRLRGRRNMEFESNMQ
jgi:hypothetical protein